jgi:peptide/nickel transport system substrate-binding protein
VFDPAQAKKLLAESGYPSGFDAGDYFLDVSYANVQEAIAGYLQQVGIRSKLRPVERAAHWSAYQDKKYKNLAYTASGAFGNAATRLETFVVAGGAYVYGSYPDVDALFKDQAAELDRKKREALLHRVQQLVHEKTMHIPIWELAFINGQGARVQESGLGLIPGHAYSAPYEDLTLKAK